MLETLWKNVRDIAQHATQDIMQLVNKQKDKLSSSTQNITANIDKALAYLDLALRIWLPLPVVGVASIRMLLINQVSYIQIH